jgi:hypothetical protein
MTQVIGEEECAERAIPAASLVSTRLLLVAVESPVERQV